MAKTFFVFALLAFLCGNCPGQVTTTTGRQILAITNGGNGQVLTYVGTNAVWSAAQTNGGTATNIPTLTAGAGLSVATNGAPQTNWTISFSSPPLTNAAAFQPASTVLSNITGVPLTNAAAFQPASTLLSNITGVPLTNAAAFQPAATALSNFTTLGTNAFQASSQVLSNFVALGTNSFQASSQVLSNFVALGTNAFQASSQVLSNFVALGTNSFQASSQVLSNFVALGTNAFQAANQMLSNFAALGTNAFQASSQTLSNYAALSTNTFQRSSTLLSNITGIPLTNAAAFQPASTLLSNITGIPLTNAAAFQPASTLLSNITGIPLTNAAAFQPASTALTNLAGGNGSALTNLNPASINGGPVTTNGVTNGSVPGFNIAGNATVTQNLYLTNPFGSIDFGGASGSSGYLNWTGGIINIYGSNGLSLGGGIGLGVTILNNMTVIGPFSATNTIYETNALNDINPGTAGLNAANLASGTVPLAALPTNLATVSSNIYNGNGGGLTNLTATNLVGIISVTNEGGGLPTLRSNNGVNLTNIPPTALLVAALTNGNAGPVGVSNNLTLASNLFAGGAVTAGTVFVGNGADITALQGSAIASGPVGGIIQASALPTNNFVAATNGVATNLVATNVMTVTAGGNTSTLVLAYNGGAASNTVTANSFGVNVGPLAIGFSSMGIGGSIFGANTSIAGTLTSVGTIFPSTVQSANYTGTNQWTGDLAFPGAVNAGLVNGNNIAVVTGTNADIYLSGPTASFTICGLAGGRDGRIVMLRYSGSQVMTLANESSADNLVNRITIPGGANLVFINSPDNIILKYQGQSNRWELITQTGAGQTGSYSGSFSGTANLSGAFSGNGQNLSAVTPIGKTNFSGFGGTNDAKIINWGTIAGGSTAFTSSVATFTAGDVTKWLRMRLGGTNNVQDYCTQIVAVNSPTSVTMSNAAPFGATNDPFVYGSPNRVALQNALNYCTSNLMTLIVNAGDYCIEGPLYDPGLITAHYNSLVYIPPTPYPSNSMMPSLGIEGAVRIKQVQFTVSNEWSSDGCSAFWLMTDGGGGGSFFSGQNYIHPCYTGGSTSLGSSNYPINMNAIGLAMSRIEIVIPDNPNFAALDLQGISSVTLDDIIITDKSPPYLGIGLSQYNHTNCNAAGILSPAVNNAGMQSFNDIYICGPYWGFMFDEHCNAKDVVVNNCMVGLGSFGGGHLAQIFNADISCCGQLLAFPGLKSTPFDITTTWESGIPSSSYVGTNFVNGMQQNTGVAAGVIRINDTSTNVPLPILFCPNVLVSYQGVISGLSLAPYWLTGITTTNNVTAYGQGYFGGNQGNVSALVLHQTNQSYPTYMQFFDWNNYQNWAFEMASSGNGNAFELAYNGGMIEQFTTSGNATFAGNVTSSAQGSGNGFIGNGGGLTNIFSIGNAAGLPVNATGVTNTGTNFGVAMVEGTATSFNIYNHYGQLIGTNTTISTTAPIPVTLSPGGSVKAASGLSGYLYYP